MTQATVKEIAPGRFDVAGSRAFVAVFSQTVGSADARQFTLTYATGPAPEVQLRRGAAQPVNLLQVPSVGVSLGGYRVQVSKTNPTPDTDVLTCTITNTSGSTGTEDWEIRSGRALPSSWNLAFADTSTTTRLVFLACDPVARIDGPAGTAENGPVELVAADARGSATEPTVIGTLPAAWNPCYSWSSDGAVDLGLPRCDAGPRLTVAVPDIPESQTVQLTVRATFGGVCPANTSYLRSTSEPTAMVVVHTDPPPTLASVAPDRAEAGQTVDVTVTGTNFLPGATFAVLGGGVAVTVLALDPSSARLRLTLDANATDGPRGLCVETVGGVAERDGLLTVLPQPRVLGVTPGRLTQRSITETHAMTITGQALGTVASVGVGGHSTAITGISATAIAVNVRINGNPKPPPGHPFTVWVGHKVPKDMPVTAVLADGRSLTLHATFEALVWAPKGEGPFDPDD